MGEITNLQRQNVPVQHKSPIKPRNTPSVPPMTLMNSISSEELSILLKDANKRLARKLKAKGCLNQEDVYIGKMKWLLAMVKTQRKLNKHNLNSFSVNIEKVRDTVDEAKFNNFFSLLLSHNFVLKLFPPIIFIFSLLLLTFSFYRSLKRALLL